MFDDALMYGLSETVGLGSAPLIGSQSANFHIKVRLSVSRCDCKQKPAT